MATCVLVSVPSVVLLLLALPAQAQRTQVSINDGWRFWNDDASGAEAPAFDDGAWERVDLPHTWNAEDAFDDVPGYRRGAGWYRRTLHLGTEVGDPARGADAPGRRRFLHVEGANQVAEVWVNGQPVGGHVGGYTAFTLDVTDAVQPGANVVAVRVDNRHDADIPPLDADFTFYGGLYRDVWLIETDAVYLSTAHGASGVRLDTPGLADGDTRVRARAEVVNHGAEAVEATVTHTLRDPAGAAVATWQQTTEIGAGETVEVEAWSGAISDPALYTPETPAVYRVETRVAAGAHEDAVTSPLGFRWVAADGDGFLLNGVRRQLVGTNRHQDVEGLGNALSDHQHRRDVQIVEETGFDFLRLAHYPQDEAVLAEADRLGLLVWEEIPVVNTITQSEAFADNAERRLTEMIRQHYNYPSVVIWGYMNEVLLRIPPDAPPDYVDDVRALAERLDAVVRAEDATRLTAMAVSFNEAEYRIADAADVFAFNLYFGWYHDTFADLGVFLDSLHAAHPDVPLMLSEYGAGSDERIHADRPVRFDFSTEHAEEFHRASLRTVLDRPWMVGSAVWNQFDFGSAGRQDTKDGINQKGLYFFDRTPKDVAFLYRAMLLDGSEHRADRVVRVERDHLHRAGPRRQSVRIFSNAPRLVVQVNGDLWDDEVAPVDGLAVVEVELAPGGNVVEAIGRWGGIEATADHATLHFADLGAFVEGAADAPPAIALNVGADHSFVDPAGLVYVSEAEWSGAVPEGGRARRTHHRIDGTEEDARFQSFRELPGTWALPRLPAGTYDLTLGLVETEDVAPGGRAFTVAVGGASLGVDLAADAGRWRAVERRVRFTLTEASAAVLRFEAPGAPPVLSSLVLRRL